MRINKYLSQFTSLSRRKADEAILAGRVRKNEQTVHIGESVSSSDKITLDGKAVSPDRHKTILLVLNKPIGFVCSRNGQGGKTIYEILPPEYQDLNPIGRLDKDSSGLLLLTNDGYLLNSLAHPSSKKEKVYEVTLNKALAVTEIEKLKKGVDIGDERPSKFKNISELGNYKYGVIIEEGRNRQIRRTFEAINVGVLKLHRTSFDDYNLGSLKPGQYKQIII